MRAFVYLVFLLAATAACRNLTPDAAVPDATPPDAGIDATPITGHVAPDGGKLNLLEFAIVGDTRPANEDDTAGYPKAVITKIWSDVAAERPPFAISTGDYMFADEAKNEQMPQITTYLAARSSYGNVVFPAMGNHECTGATASNCGINSADGITRNYDVYMKQLVVPLGFTLPYYEVRVDAQDGSWTSKFVFVAANAWSDAQATWLDAALAEPTTYTFVVRHEGSTATDAPGVIPSAGILAAHPYTLLIAGHTHTYAWYPGTKEVIVGNGGAPITGSVDYGYVIARMRDDGAIVFTAHEYQGRAQIGRFVVDANGNEIH